jgi:hypothetical protein
MNYEAFALPVALARILLLCLPLILVPAVGAAKEQQTICCRSSGGTRGTCLNLWTHLVPPENRFYVGPSRRIALLQGPSVNGTSMSVQLFGPAGETLVDQVLPPERAVVWLLTLPQSVQPEFGQPLIWESFPSCQPNRPPARTLLEAGSLATNGAPPLALLHKSCGKEVNTVQLLRAFQLEEWQGKLPSSLPVRCLPLKVEPAAITPKPGNGSIP